MPIFYKTVYNENPINESIYLVIVLTISSLLGVYIGGYLSDKFSSRFNHGRIIVCLISTILAIPCTFIQLFSPSLSVSYIFFFISSFFAEMWFGITFSLVFVISPSNITSIATAIYLLSIGIGSLSPAFVGLLETFIDDIRYSLFFIICGGYFFASLGYIALLFFRHRAIQKINFYDSISVELSDFDFDDEEIDNINYINDNNNKNGHNKIEQDIFYVNDYLDHNEYNTSDSDDGF
eukprot:TRINITY_DN2763_c1_g2_i1.p1 TRINITY_DN2763_c1_g2~~TRINITY_DN2763_c1_g2_i1.p1  ORF type:complete len:236 (-),score=38.82 TRINITY_DN2763_c1_g2_i1:28-735(-)